MRKVARWFVTMGSVAALTAACIAPQSMTPDAPTPGKPMDFGKPNGPVTRSRLVPLPRNLVEQDGELVLGAEARIVAEGDARAEGEMLATVLRRSTGYALPVVSGPAKPGDIALELAPDLAESLGDEGYKLEVKDSVTLRAAKAAGLFYAGVTLRQCFPPDIEASSVKSGVAWRLPNVQIEDSPKYGWRGLSVDLARHFFPLADVQHWIELAAYHKLNRVHLHLSDDQGFRLEIKSWPKLTSVGSKSQVGGGAGGFFTQQQYREIVAFAQARHIVIIPEIDMPGHVQAALASYGELNPDDKPKEPYTGTDVGFSSLSFRDPDTTRFIEDVLREVAELTPGPYLHIGGDEAKATDPRDYRAFLKQVGEVVAKHGKILVGWCEAGEAGLPRGSLLQDWHLGCTGSARGVENGHRVIASPAKQAYLDMKYTSLTPYGHNWAGLVELQQAYEWQPQIEGVPAEAVAGIESALWTEHIENRAEADYMIFPRLAGHAELGWLGPVRNFAEYRTRLAYHGKRLRALGVNFYESPQVDWEK